MKLIAVFLACREDPKPGPGGGGGGDDSDPVEELPPRSGPWQRDEAEAPGSISFNELLYNPGSGAQGEWIELHNPMALDMDLSGWSLDGAVRFAFPEGSVIPAGGFLVVAATPSGGALGPWEGALSDSGARLELWNNSGRLIDTLTYGEDDPWPVGADGSGFTLAKVDPDTASDHAENWSVSAEAGGTLGASNNLDPRGPVSTLELVASDATWRWDASGAPGAGWEQPDFDDSAWSEGEAPFFFGGSTESALATATVTADNYYALYLGRADGSDMRLVGEDAYGDWTSVDRVEIEVGPEDHLYLAAWEAPWDYGGPQMTIAEVDLGDEVVGTDIDGWEWALAPAGDCPGTPDPPPQVGDLTALVQAAEADGSWAAPAVEAEPSSSPWGWALSGSFSSSTRYIWADTFSDTSITNTQNTYALFRTREPVLGARGQTELPSNPTTATFRTNFGLDADPAAVTLALQCTIDDGAVVYLNGVEVLRQNMPAGAVDATTLASAPASEGGELFANLSTAALQRGENLLAVEVHQAELDDPDMAFGCELSARVDAGGPAPMAALNEVGPAAEGWAEILPLRALEEEGMILAAAGGERLIPAATMEAGELITLDELGFPVEVGDVLFLYSEDRSALLDAVRVGEGTRARADEGGPWRTPTASTPGEPNRIDVHDEVVINEIMYHRAPLSTDGQPVTDRPEEWIELFNRGETEVDLSGWQLVDAVAFTFPEGSTLAPGATLVVANDAAALSAANPGIAVIGDFSGKLGNRGDRILLLDERGNPADDVRYYDGGRWPEAADGGGSSLELRDPDADNSAPEAWAASDESDRSSWTTVRYRAVAQSSAVGPDGTWEELVLGLLGDGVVLIDDLSVIQDPDGAPMELIQNGGFDAGDSAWRIIGNHRRSSIVADPDEGSNAVLRLVATGPTGHMHNHAETTLLRAVGATEYEISYRARWISGTNQVNTRLYFNRLPHTALIPQPERSGTPGAPNSTLVENAGPTFSDFGQDVAVPAAGEPVTIRVSAADPDGVQGMTLWSSVDGAAFQPQAMGELSPGRWSAVLGGQSAGAVVQVYVEAEDGLGATSTFPAAGPDSRALIKVDDGKAAENGLHNFRIVITDADSDWLHDDVNLMSDDLVGATVIYDEHRVFYDVGVRTKGSERGRPEDVRLGYGVRFHAEEPFRGSHRSVLIDRSEGVGFGQREVLLNLVMTHAGAVSGEYNDLTQVLTPLPQHVGPAELQLDRFTDLVLDAQFEDGAEGQLFEYELIYYPYTTDDGTAQGNKLPQPDAVVGTALTDLGDDKEAYRWNFMIQNNEREDDYSGLILLNQTFALSGSSFLEMAPEVIDVDQWLRAFAFATLSGAVDNYGSDGSQHNARFYVRPEDGKVLYFPHDLDFFGWSSMSLVGNSDLAELLQDPVNLRTYYGHLQDIVGRAYGTDYLGPWCDQLGELLPAQDISGHCQFIDDRADWVMYSSPDAVTARFPPVDFRITSNGGADFSVAGAEVTLQGEGWIDVRQIVVGELALTPEWDAAQGWQLTLPLQPGPNTLELQAIDLHGEVVGEDSITVSGE